ncbi:hypothetical protein A2159_01975 [Candidatus Woesebacteria bacterium RBG_13_34_9]|uniref:Mannosyl-glycoprotein endo-beta-N-acetylglucosamidase-like domain-containing protein n=1 Tax=Candidatus Woesebacteria bacterium RBG_13_34_9 TaxID=1802477 RepID=A0A1F7WZK7_9BACT|nr:MAG: hypothetical protein A2159_01975 [Candidatus Woesebacteria bacterium RBG_13_34_9]
MERSNNNGIPFWKSIVIITIFLTITPLTLTSCVISLIALTTSKNTLAVSNNNLLDSPIPGINVYASLPEDNPGIDAEIISADARPIIVQNFLNKYDSPLEKYSDLIVQTSDKYKIDWRLITAIAMKESGLCKAIPENSFNCWGWGIHSKGTLMFDNYEEAIDAVTQGLKEHYIDKGYVTVEEIMSKYAHPDSTTWANDVSNYMNQIK